MQHCATDVLNDLFLLIFTVRDTVKLIRFGTQFVL